MARYVDPGHIPGPVFIPNCVSLRLIWQLPNGKTASNVLHASYTVQPARTQAFLNTIFTMVSTAFTASSHSNSLHTSCSLTAVGIRDMAQTTPAGGYGELLSNLAAVPGAGTGDPLPANVSFVVSLKTGGRGQANRGRVYLPGFTEATNGATGQISDAARNAAVDFLGRIDAGLTTNNLELAIAHPARQAYTGATGAQIPARSAGTVQVTGIVAPNLVWDSTRLRQLR